MFAEFECDPKNSANVSLRISIQEMRFSFTKMWELLRKFNEIRIAREISQIAKFNLMRTTAEY
ncbi:hypothetical protein E4413_02570 [Leptospira interrogans]|nr:hypothetical protein C5473_09670 [Leptospira interrogans serovar Weerasinghe]KAA1291141.1 hypothetical protein C4X99_12830 [Leptospira interrogans serovar Geyaweera]QCO31927.1 hypothetical protein E4414_01520 [Leptospira interrogans]QCO38518.1 hypothetical protein E4412_16090 [Leptospira interrogans]QCO39942.1 hypothetical protein E4413_02570 [Leptospira interrogans]